MHFIAPLAYSQDGDQIHLEQDDGAGTLHRVTLHRLHLQHIAGHLGVPVPDATAAALVRRLRAVADRLRHLADDRMLLDDVSDKCIGGPEFVAELGAVADLAAEFAADLGPAK